MTAFWIESCCGIIIELSGIMIVAKAWILLEQQPEQVRTSHLIGSLDQSDVAIDQGRKDSLPEEEGPVPRSESE